LPRARQFRLCLLQRARERFNLVVQSLGILRRGRWSILRKRPRAEQQANQEQAMARAAGIAQQGFHVPPPSSKRPQASLICSTARLRAVQAFSNLTPSREKRLRASAST